MKPLQKSSGVLLSDPCEEGSVTEHTAKGCLKKQSTQNKIQLTLNLYDCIFSYGTQKPKFPSNDSEWGLKMSSL